MLDRVAYLPKFKFRPSPFQTWTNVVSAETENTNFRVLALTLPGLEPIIYRIRGEHVNHYITDAVEPIVWYFSM